MNAKSKLLVKYAEGVIEMNTTFAKEMRNPLSDEYALLQKTKMENPGFTVSRRQIKSNPKKDTYKGLTYEYMKKYIKLHETKEEAEKVIAYLEDQILISKCHSQRLRYPTIKKWFLAKYPEVAEFGMPSSELMKPKTRTTSRTKHRPPKPRTRMRFLQAKFPISMMFRLPQ